MSDATSNWKRLFDLAMPAVDHIFGPPVVKNNPDWTFGGGTALMLQIKHRVSYDIDISIHGARLKEFTPARNPGAAAISARPQWPGHYLRSELPSGEIDFLSAGLQTEPGFGWKKIEGRPVAVETPEEIIVKKIRYRSESPKARDAFDLAAVAQVRPALAQTLADEVLDALERKDGAGRRRRHLYPDVPGSPAASACNCQKKRGRTSDHHGDGERAGASVTPNTHTK